MESSSAKTINNYSTLWGVKTVLDKNFRSILDELDALCIERDKENVIESRANHVITSAINLIEHINQVYDDEIALELERRLVNSIRGKDPKKFTRKLKQLQERKNGTK